MTDGRSLAAWTAAAAGAGVAIGAALPDSLLTGVGVAAAVVLLALAVRADLGSRRIPNRLTLPGLAAALACAAAAGATPGVAALTGALLAGGYFLAFALAAPGRLGVGDAKLAAFGGGVVGIGAVPLLLLASTLLGALWGIALLAVRRGGRETFAYGPAIAFGIVAAIARFGLVVSPR